MSLLEVVKKCNIFYKAPVENYTPFYIDDKKVGILRKDAMKVLLDYPAVFNVHKKNESFEKIELDPSLETYEQRSKSVHNVLQDLREKRKLKCLSGWRNEDFNVWHDLSEPSLMQMERTGTSIFGVKQCGVHINGFFHHKDKGILMWIGKRAKSKPTFPGMLDNMVGGGLAAGEKFLEAAIRECKEEASVPDHLLKNIKPAGCISYMYEDERGVFPEIQYTYDIELPSDFVPVNSDGEVQSFQLMSIDEIKCKILAGEFKFNCAAVIVDFFVRHGIITPDNELNYWEIIRWLHDPLF